MPKITAIIHTLNEEKNIKNCLESVKWCDEIIVIDMYSQDKTVEVAKLYTDRIFFHKKMDYVEPARNFGLTKATNDWILSLDADERISEELKNKLIEIAKDGKYDVIYIPMKNIIFSKWIKHTQWWPDYHPRFFRKGFMKYTNNIHDSEKTSGRRLYLEAVPENAMMHYNYQNVSHFLQKLDRYTTIEAKILQNKKIKFSITKLLDKSIKEFIWRYILGKGFLDGIHGFILSCLMSFYWFIVYIKLWEMQKQK